MQGSPTVDNDPTDLERKFTNKLSMSNIGNRSTFISGLIIQFEIICFIALIISVSSSPVNAVNRIFSSFTKNGLYVIDTGIDTIDKIERDESYAIEFTMGSGTGTYTVEETVSQGAAFGSATATGEVAAWNATSKVLKLINLTGIFSSSSNIIGNTSGASFGISTFDNQAQPTDPTANNVGIETAADSVIDFSEGNPFSEGTNY